MQIIPLQIKWLILLLLPIFIDACAITAPTVVHSEGIDLGQSKKEIDLYFLKQNNNSGHWQTALLFETISEGKIERSYLYRWRAKSFFMWQRPGLSSYYLTFLNGRLRAQKTWAPNQNSDIDPMCQKAIIQNRKDETFIHC